MRKYTETKNNQSITYYEIDVTNEMKDKALAFAKELIATDNQYSRLLPNAIRNSGNINDRQKIEIQRTYMGKLGELAFADFLIKKGKRLELNGMLDIYQGQDNVDEFDFITKDKHTVDVKTGFRNIHKRLLINLEQFENIPKDYYVAVLLNASDTDTNAKLVDWNSVTAAKILGYADHAFINKCQCNNFGEGHAKCCLYSELMEIDEIVPLF